jgi:hypothetical protein
LASGMLQSIYALISAFLKYCYNPSSIHAIYIEPAGDVSSANVAAEPEREFTSVLIKKPK